MKQQAGNCNKCGAPIWIESPWFSIAPPTPEYSCGCYQTSNIKYSDSTVNDLSSNK